MDTGAVGRCHLIAIPYPGRGHINPMLNLCHSLSRRRPDLLVTVVVTEEWFGLLGSDHRLKAMRVRTIPNVLPSEHGRFTDMPGFLHAVHTRMEAPIDRLLTKLEPPPSALMADTFLSWAVDSGRRRNIPVASFWPMNATVFSAFYHFNLVQQRGHYPTNLEDRADEIVDYIPGVSPMRLADLPSMIHLSNNFLLDLTLQAIKRAPENRYLLLSSAYELEADAVDAIRSVLPITVRCVGPLIPTALAPPAIAEYMTWLDSRSEGSVIYVSMGSLVSVSDEQMNEIAAGLAESGYWYMWVARGGALLPQEVSCERSLVVGWCDQMTVLRHAAVGGFWTHCGWNSVQEGLFCGVPMLGFPVAVDQGPNSKMIECDWGVGMRAKREQWKADDLVSRREVSELVRGFMDADGGDRKKMMHKANKIRVLLQQTRAAGGSSDLDEESFVSDLTNPISSNDSCCSVGGLCS